MGDLVGRSDILFPLQAPHSGIVERVVPFANWTDKKGLNPIYSHDPSSSPSSSFPFSSKTAFQHFFIVSSSRVKNRRDRQKKEILL